MIADASGGELAHLHSGKVRDLYRTADGHLLMVASDRMSAFDFILPDPIQDKGRILTAMTVWWFSQLGDVVDNHLVSYDDVRIPDEWRGRAMICQPLDMIGVEAVARGYLAGGGYAEYQRQGSVCGVSLPAGLQDGDRLSEPIFTPSSKAPIGEHDENISFAAVTEQLGPERADQLRTATLDLYTRAAEIAGARGIILADTKFEFGVRPGGDTLVLGDEVLTPDSSRFWPADGWQPGRSQPSFDKQYVRDWLTSPASGWDRASGAAPPPLPAEVAAATRQRYIEAYETLTGLSFADWLSPSRTASRPETGDTRPENAVSGRKAQGMDGVGGAR